MMRKTLDAVLAGDARKGDVLGAARIAGIMAAKRTHELIPLCHPLALSQVTVDIEPGIIGFVGANGAGKTTMGRMLTTLLRPDAGRAAVAGHDVLTEPQAVRASIGLSGQFAAIDENLTGRENLWLFGRLYQLSSQQAAKRAGELLEQFALTDAADRPAKTYSGGMRRRLDLAGSLIVHPEVLFLAEAFTRPKMMQTLAKLGFSQSYTYFTWRNYKNELIEYLTELAHGEMVDYYRPNFWPNTPDILHEYLQVGGRPAFQVRMVLAALLAPSWGIYSGYELVENTPLHEGSEEYHRSEKYNYRPRDFDAPHSIAPYLTRLNDIRRSVGVSIGPPKTSIAP